MFGANRAIPFGVFKVEGDNVQYYTGEKLTQFVSELSKN